MKLVALEDLEEAGFYGCPVYLVPEGPSNDEWRARVESAMGRPFPTEDEDWLYDELPAALEAVGWVKLESPR